MVARRFIRFGRFCL